MTKISKAFAFFTGLTRTSGKAPAPKPPAATRPAVSAALQDLASRKAATLPTASSIDSGTARRRVSARDLPRAGAASRARAEAIATAREAARIRALPSPALPLDLQMRFDALKSGMPRQGGGSGALGSEKAEAPKAEAPKAEAPKAEAPKAEAPKAEAPKAEAPKAEAPKAEAPKMEDLNPLHPDAQRLEGLAGQVHGHVNAMHHALAAPPSRQNQLLQQEIAELNELAIIISQILQSIVRRSGEALLSITRGSA